MTNGQEHILLVDDDDINNFLSQEIISHHRPQAHIVAKLTVKDALDYLEDLNDKDAALPDIILVDINMPWLNGWDFIESFEKRSWKGVENSRLYIYTSSVYYKDLDKGKSYQSVSDIFSKPLTEDMLHKIFREGDQSIK